MTIQHNTILKGKIFYQSIDQLRDEPVECDAILRYGQYLLFNFRDCNLCINLKYLVLSSIEIDKIDYVDNFNNHACDLHGWSMQTLTVNDMAIILLSGILEIKDGLPSGSFKINCFFPKSKSIILKYINIDF